MLESKYQAYLIRELGLWFDGCIVIKNPTEYIQGLPDLTILYRDKWAWLEVKTSKYSRPRPNQEYYIDLANRMSAFGAFIFPENEEEVLLALQSAFQS